MKVILVHGFRKTYKDMQTIKIHLEKCGFTCYTPDLPLTFREFDRAVPLLEKFIIDHLEEKESFHLIGHSTGGLVIRKLISDGAYNNQVKRIILIATPNKGSYLAQLAHKFKWYTSIFKTLKSLTPEYIQSLNLQHDSNIEVGIIRGNLNNLLLGKFIKGENDGRVELDSAHLATFKDELVLPYGHNDIHHMSDTINYIETFLKEGYFKSK